MSNFHPDFKLGVWNFDFNHLNERSSNEKK